jgi:hypothetical protein
MTVIQSSDRLLGEARSHLEHLQEGVYRSLGIDPEKHAYMEPTFRDTFLREFYEKCGPSDLSFDEFRAITEKAWDLGYADAPSRYEHPYWYSLVKRQAGSIEKEIAAAELKLATPVIFGTLPTGRVNGYALSVPDNPFRIIVLEEGLFGFANLMCKAIATALPPASLKNDCEEQRINFSTDISKIRSHIRSNPAISQRFLECLLAYVVVGHPHAAPPYLPDRNIAALSAVMRQSMEMFVLAHEMAISLQVTLMMHQSRKGNCGDSPELESRACRRHAWRKVYDIRHDEGRLRLGTQLLGC